MIYGYMHRRKKSVSFFGYVKKRSYPKGYNRKCGVYKDILSALGTIISLFVGDKSFLRHRHIYGRQCAGEPKRVRARPIKDELRLKGTKKDELK